MASVGSIDVEVLLIGWLQGQLGDGIVVRDELDNNLLAELPTVQVERVGGTDDTFRLDRALVDIDVYAATRGAAADLAAVIRGLLLQLPGSTVGGAVIGRVRTESAPVKRPYENTGLRRVGGTFSLYLHPVS
ncbi:hypothetical protein OG229_02230 [Streptomyces platensis]|uniref:hypothetical protein n=1 Tax=Streptomyces platensis TaxID=58346 RepID=UPI002E11E16E|nr:hypothetical protein OG229_02230 [Streptomyces platensis]